MLFMDGFPTPKKLIVRGENIVAIPDAAYNVAGRGGR
jgi:hypothetical protein